MSVLIKGMKMPTSCVDCPCVNDEPRYCRPTNCFIPMTGKPKFCPLVEIPSHVRLIGADLGISDEDIYVKYTIEEDAPTVIEAEEEQEE